MKLNYEKLLKDLEDEFENRDTTASIMCQEIKVSYTVFVSIRNSQDLRIGNLLKVLNWLEKGIENYIIR